MHVVNLGASALSIGALVKGSGIVTGTLWRWIPADVTADVNFPLGNATTNELLTIKMTAAPTTGGVASVTYTDASPGYVPVAFPDQANNVTVVNRSTASWAIQTSGIIGGTYGLSVTNTHLAPFPICRLYT